MMSQRSSSGPEPDAEPGDLRCSTSLGHLSRPVLSCRTSHRDVDSRVDAERGVLGGEGAASVVHHHRVAGADVSVGDELVVEATLAAGVVGLAHRQKVGRQASGHHLASVDKDVCGEQSESKNTCDTQTHHETLHTRLQGLPVLMPVHFQAWRPSGSTPWSWEVWRKTASHR